MPILRPDEAGSQRALTPREAASRLGCTEPTVKAHIESDDGLLEGWWDQPGRNRRWSVWEGSVERVARSGGLRGARFVANGSVPQVGSGELRVVRDDVQRLAASVEELASTVARRSADEEGYWRQRAERLEQVLWQVVSAGGELATATVDHAATSERLRAAARAQAEALNMLAGSPSAPADEPSP